MKTLTAEQKAKSEARKAMFRDLVKRLAHMSDAERAHFSTSLGAVVNLEGHQLSTHNTMLIAFQRGGCTVVSGFRQWLKHGRAVRKGEHGVMIWVPCGTGRKSDAGPDEHFIPGTMPDGSESVGGVRFVSSTVFDVSQTDAIEEAAPVADLDSRRAAQSATVSGELALIG